MPLYALTLFLSALLLFAVQPMVAKQLLPALGGTPAVWNTCMVFFQASLLIGYLYAHGISARLTPRKQVLLHTFVLLLPMVFLPIAMHSATPPDSTSPVAWLLGSLIRTAALPLVVVSASAPLLQRWFACSGHRLSHDPYFLYAASNAGSLLALLAYPLIVEPTLTLGTQATIWSGGYVVLAVTIAVCGLLATRRGAADGQVHEAPLHERAGPRVRLRWLLLAALPSSLLLGVTTHLTTNVASVPLLWVLPLALYLTTFILTFARQPPLPHRFFALVVPWIVLVVGPLILFDIRDLGWLGGPPHLLLFFLLSMACHGELVRSRPGTAGLTGFYLWIAAGGVLGGLFNAIVAPQVFETVVEYPLAVAAICFFLPARSEGGRGARILDWLLPAALAVAAMVGLWIAESRDERTLLVAATLTAVLAALTSVLQERPLRFGLGVAVYLAAIAWYAGGAGETVHHERNFFGVKSVVIDREAGLVKFVHGTTTHGMQWLDPRRRNEPVAYYHRKGPIGDVFEALREARPSARVAVVGLGAGGLAPYARAADQFSFFEIDPAVERIARNPRWFGYLEACGPRCTVRIGDGRLLLERAAPEVFDLIVLDAFSSDAVPTHLLTREALQIYLDRLAPEGLLVFNVTNAFIDLEPVMAALAADAGLSALRRRDDRLGPEKSRDGRMLSHYVAMSRDSADFGTLRDEGGWRSLRVDRRLMWTDRFSDIVSLLRRPGDP